MTPDFFEECMKNSQDNIVESASRKALEIKQRHQPEDREMDMIEARSNIVSSVLVMELQNKLYHTLNDKKKLESEEDAAVTSGPLPGQSKGVECESHQGGTTQKA